MRDGRHHASARQHVVVFATRVPRKGLAAVPKSPCPRSNGHFLLAFGNLGFAETPGGKESARLNRVGRAGLARGDEARAEARSSTTMIASIPHVDPHRGPVDLSYAAEAREEKPMLPGGKISNLTAKRLRAEIRARKRREARGLPPTKADATAKAPAAWPPEKYDDGCRVPKLREEYFEHDQGEGTRAVVLALTERAASLGVAFARFWRVISFCQPKPNPLTLSPTRPSKQATGNRAS